jgi:hypothetical protein
MGRKMLMLGVGIIVLMILIAIVAAMTGGDDNQAPTPTPTPSASVTVSVQTKTLTSYFGNPDATANLSSGAPADDLRNTLLTAEPAGRLADVIEVRQDNARLTAAAFLAVALGTVPADLASALGSDLAVLAYGQTEIYDAAGAKTEASTIKPRLAVVVEVSDASTANQAMTAWESAGLASAAAEAFEYSTAQKIVDGFSSGSYRQIPVRYWNFPSADQSLDWAIALASNGKNYLVMTGSRESAFFAIDQLMQ